MIRQVATPRLSFLMRSAQMPYLQRPVVYPIAPVSPQGLTPWYAGMGNVIEPSASMQPRNNPVFNDAWVVGATGGANRVVPQGIDYSRTPCCTAHSGMGMFDDVNPLWFGVVAIPAAYLLLNLLMNR